MIARARQLSQPRKIGYILPNLDFRTK
jgi:hypothetical protein